MTKIKMKQRLSYWFDNALARGPFVLIGWLGLITVLLVALATLIALLFGVQPVGTGLKEVFWDFLFQVLTPNPFDVTAPGLFLLIMLVITLASLLMVSILIGILTASIESRLDAMRRGRSKVLEQNHTIILGWSHQIFTILSELIIANENRKQGAVIVILANQDKVLMEDALRERILNPKNTRIICRSGSPMDLDDLEIVSPHTARSIIILPPEEGNADTYVIKTILAIVNNPKRHAKPYNIVTQLNSDHNVDVVKMLESHDHIHTLLMGDQIARIVAQTSRQSGLSVVYTELLNFSGDEIYFQLEPKLAGKTYGDALLAYEDTSLIGLRLASGEIQLNPPMDTLIRDDDHVIVIAADDGAARVSNLTQVPLSLEVVRPPASARRPAPEKGLILGWNSKAPLIIEELDSYVAANSELLVVAERDVAEEIKDIGARLKNQHVVFRYGDTSDRHTLNAIDIPSFQHIIVLAYEDMEVQAADAETMVTLLHLRNILGGNHCAIVSEMLDLRNRRLAEVARVDDFIVSDHLISLMLSQISENNELYDIFNSLFDPIGPEFYLKPVTDYVEVGKPISFYTLVLAARQRGETAVGYRVLREVNDATKSYGIHTNPRKSDLITLSADDKIVVLAECA